MKILPVLLLSLLAAGSTLGTAGADEPEALLLAQTEIDLDALLDVGIVIFDPGLPEESDSSLEEEGIFAEVRKAEARYMAFQLKNTLEASGHWGAVRVVPETAQALDLTVTGAIIKSTGLELTLRVRVADATGRGWRAKEYDGRAAADAYDPDRLEARDPFQSLYNEVANDMLEALHNRDVAEIATIREVAWLRFGADLAPDIFGNYLRPKGKDRYAIERLPAPEDTMWARVAAMRQRDEMFVDTLNEYYADFHVRMGEPYQQWRLYSYDEELALEEIRRQARNRKIAGGLMMVLGILGGASGSGTAGAAGEAAVIGGAMVIESGIQKGREAQMHVAALRELASSFDSEIAPVLVKVDGRTLQLEGSAETQFGEWRRLLHTIFAAETGFPLDPDSGEVEPDPAASG
jgi:hypothetical protein